MSSWRHVLWVCPRGFRSWSRQNLLHTEQVPHWLFGQKAISPTGRAVRGCLFHCIRKHLISGNFTIQGNDCLGNILFYVWDIICEMIAHFDNIYCRFVRGICRWRRFPTQMISDVELRFIGIWHPEVAVGQTIELPVISNAVCKLERR